MITKIDRKGELKDALFIIEVARDKNKKIGIWLHGYVDKLEDETISKEEITFLKELNAYVKYITSTMNNVINENFPQFHLNPKENIYSKEYNDKLTVKDLNIKIEG